MKKFVSTTRLISLLFALALASCEANFVPDPLDPRLPQYSENGNNVAGAYVNDAIWTSEVELGFFTSYNKPLIVAAPSVDSLWIYFTGTMGNDKTYIAFKLKGIKIETLDELKNLSGAKIRLDGVQNAGYCFCDYPTTPFGTGCHGQIYFKRVRRTEDASLLIISGTFGFQKDYPNGTTQTVFSGRFDYRIRDNDEFIME